MKKKNKTINKRMEAELEECEIFLQQAGLEENTVDKLKGLFVLRKLFLAV